MKVVLLFLCLVTTILATEHRILITGFTKHEKSYSSDSEKFNEENYGAGYEFTNFKKYGKVYFAGNFTVLRDSYKDAQYTLSVSPNLRFKIVKDLDWSFGLALFTMWKKDTYKKGVSSDEARYALSPGMAAMTSIYYKKFSVNFAYVPSVETGNIDVVGFVIVYFGWKL
jgi:Antimicrobial peptide resistance and lipid A acylation protein PagP